MPAPKDPEKYKQWINNLKNCNNSGWFKKDREVSPNSGMFQKGHRPWNWNGRNYSELDLLKHSKEYVGWRKAVFKRDKYACVNCGVTKCYIEADHIKPKSKFPELMFDVENGRTLCKPCHMETDTYGGKAIKMKLLKV